jgi:hypothetical protein
VFLGRPGFSGTPLFFRGKPAEATPILRSSSTLEISPANALLLNGAVQTANREIGAPGFQPKTPFRTIETQLEEKAFKWGKAEFAAAVS